MSSSGVAYGSVIDAHLGGDSTGLVPKVAARTIKPAASEVTLYVSPRGSDGSDGLTVATCKATIRGALTAIGNQPGVIRVGVGTITESVAWGTLPDGLDIIGAGKNSTTINVAFNGLLATAGTGNHIAHMTINGQGDTYTSSGIYFAGSKGNQHLESLALISFNGPCLEFEIGAGSGLRASGLVSYRTAAGTGTGRYAVVIQNTALQNSAVPRRFHMFDSAGMCAIDFGSCNNVHITSSVMADLNWTSNSRGVNIVSSRWLNQPACTLYGANNSIVGSDILPQLTVGPGASAITVGPGSFDNPLIIDNSGSMSNSINHYNMQFPATFTASSGGASLGSGTLTAYYSRSGSQIVVNYQLVVASDTNFGSGYLQFGLPYTRASAQVAYCGQGQIEVGATYTTVQAQITGATNWVRLLPINSSSPVTGTAPAALAAGTTVRFSITYQQ